MAEKRENSVLFSLRELRQIEDQRVQEEVDAQKAEAEARTKAQQDAERRKREEEEAARRAAEEAERNRVETIERTRREEALRLAESEARARVEANARLEEQRLKMEMHVKVTEAANKRPKVLMAVAGALVLVVVGLGYWAYSRSQEAAKRDAEHKAQLAMLDKRIGDSLTEIDRLNQEKDTLFEKRLQAATDEEKRRLDEEIRRNEERRRDEQRKLEQLRQQRGGKGGDTRPDKPPRDRGVQVNCDPNDPLCGVSK